MCLLTICSILSSCSRVSALKCAKSKRRRSGATSEPACLTCGRGPARSAAWSRCVAVWLRRVAARRRTRRFPRRPARQSRCRRCAHGPCARGRRSPPLPTSLTLALKPKSLPSVPTSDTWPPLCEVEGRFLEHDPAGVRPTAASALQRAARRPCSFASATHARPGGRVVVARERGCRDVGKPGKRLSPRAAALELAAPRAPSRAGLPSRARTPRDRARACGPRPCPR